jgi:hypothetical protein
MNNKGYLLPMAIIFIIIAAILGMGILYLGGLEQIGARKRLNREKAFYIAEAGAYWAYAYLKDDVDKDGVTETMQDGEFSIEINPEYNGNSSMKEIISTGTINNVEETVSLILASEGGGNSWSQGLFGSDSVFMQNNVDIYGYDSTNDPYGNNPVSGAAVGSLLSIELQNSAEIHGNAYVTSEGEIIWNGDNIEEVYENHVFDEPLNQDPLPPVVIPSDLLTAGPGGKFEKTSNYSIPGGDYRFQEMKTGGNAVISFTGDLTRIYIEKKLEIENNCIWNIQGTLVLYLGEDSNLFVKNNSEIGILQPDGSVVPNLPKDFRIYSASTKDDAVILENNSDMAALIYVPEGRVLIKNNRTFLGGIVADELYFDNNVTVLYDLSLENTQIPDDPGGGGGPGQLTIIRWTKPNWARFNPDS